MLPIRRGHAGDVPADGASGENEWDGFIPFDRLPQAFNPPSGIIVSANQNPFPADYPYPVNGNFAPYFRARQVRDRLQSRARWTAQDLLALQSDVYSAFHRFLAQAMVAAYDKRNSRTPSLDEAAGLLRKWNGQMDRDQAAPFIAALAWQHARTAVAENAAPGSGQAYDYPIGPAVVEKLFRERPNGWFRDYDETLLRVFIDSVEEATRIQGRDPNRWRYGAWFQLGLNNPVIHNMPWIGRYFDLRPVAMSGSGTTVKQTTRRVGPSMRMNADAGDWERSLLNIPVGQSGQIFSSHYRDQWSRFQQGLSFPMQFHKVEAKNTLELRPAK
jgi:penicillin amidase